VRWGGLKVGGKTELPAHKRGGGFEGLRGKRGKRKKKLGCSTAKNSRGKSEKGKGENTGPGRGVALQKGTRKLDTENATKEKTKRQKGRGGQETFQMANRVKKKKRGWGFRRGSKKRGPKSVANEPGGGEKRIGKVEGNFPRMKRLARSGKRKKKCHTQEKGGKDNWWRGETQRGFAKWGTGP